MNACAAPAPVIEYIAPPSATTRLSLCRDPEFSVPAVVGFCLTNRWFFSVRGRVSFARAQSNPSGNRSLPEPESVERVQQHTVEQLVHLPVPQIQEQIVESVQVIPRELFPERVEE